MGDSADNPDQRIAEDINLFVDRTLTITVGLLSAIVTLLSFLTILWTLSALAPLRLFGTMVAVNLQAAFLSPPVAMSAFYLKGVSPKHVTLNQIFAGMMPYMIIVLVCLAFMYIWPGMTLWLPEFLYGD